MLLNESGIKLPKGATSAKVLGHEDMDGFCSVVLTVNQLEKQGIPKNRITVDWVQYGRDDLLDKATKKNKYQALLSVDFSAYPVADLPYLFAVLSRKKGEEESNFQTKYLGDFEAFKREFLDKGIKPSSKQVYDYIDKATDGQGDLIKNRSSVQDKFDLFMKGIKKYKKGDKPESIKIVDVDYMSDHHDNSRDNLSPGKSGKIGAAYPSDTEHIATVAAQNMINWDDLKEISKVDSARYDDVENTIKQSGNLKGAGRKERLAVLCNALVTSIISSNKRLASSMAKEVKPSLISIYNTALKYNKLNDNELKIFSELKKPEPDWNLINELKGTLPNDEQKKVFKSGASSGVKTSQTLDAMRSKNQRSVDVNTNKATSHYKPNGVVLVQDATTNPKEGFPRYLGTMISNEGKRFPFIIKKLNMMIQIQGNPAIPENIKKNVDLAETGKKAIEYAQNKIQSEDSRGKMATDWAWNIIKKESGGHKTIFNISGLGTLGAASLKSAERAELKYLEAKGKRISGLSSKLDKNRSKLKKEMKGRISPRIEELTALKEGNDIRKKAMDYMIDYIVKDLNAKYKNLEIPKHSDEYELK